MRSFNSFQLDDEKVARLEYIESLFDDAKAELLSLVPSEHNGGFNEIKNLLNNPFHLYTEDSTFLKRYNTSPVCGFEIWYDSGEINFYWYVPNEEIEEKYRRHLYNRYSDGQIGANLEKFLPVSDGDHFAGTEYHLNHHYFEPVNHKGSGFNFSNIYEDLLSEIDTKDESRVFFQVLFKPAEDDWVKLHTLTIDEVAEKYNLDSKTESKYFGLVTKERPLSSEEKKLPGIIQDQREKKAYYVNFRVGVLAPTSEEAKREMRDIDDIIKYTFESPSGQNFVPERNSEKEMKQLIEDMVSRRPQNMEQPKTIKKYLQHRLANTYRHTIMTVPEVASIAHIPNSSEVDMEGINWAVVDADGTLPPGAADFEEPSDTERAEVLEELQKHTPTRKKMEENGE